MFSFLHSSPYGAFSHLEYNEFVTQVKDKFIQALKKISDVLVLLEIKPV